MARANTLHKKRKELAPIISDFLFHNEDNPIPQQKDYVKLKIEIRDALKEASFRKVISQILLDLQKDISGETQKKLNDLYYQLDLHHDAYKKLKDWRWHIVSKGISELTQMQVEDSFSILIKFINDRRSIVRKQAEIATVSLKPDGINYLLDTTRHTISEWQQLKIMEVLRGIEHFRPPAFKNWLVSNNRDVVLFSLRLIRYYNQNDAAASIIELVKHKNERIKLEAVQCVKEFCLISALNTLKAVFPKAGQAVKIEILDTLATLGTEEDLEFLKIVEKSNTAFLVKNKAQMAINEILPETFIPSKDIFSQKELDKAVLTEQHFNEEELDKEIQKIAFSNENEIENSLIQHSNDLPHIEVFEVDTKTTFIDEVEKSNDITNPIKEASEPTFEIEPLEKAFDASINKQIGLVNPNQEDGLHTINEELSEVNQYFALNLDEKTEFIKLLEASATEKDSALLEEIMQKEDDSEIRYRLFKIVKSIQEENNQADWNADDSITESIFQNLYEYASDQDSKLILINEIGEVGDKKELSFLKLLENDENATIRNQVKKTKQILLKKLNEHAYDYDFQNVATITNTAQKIFSKIEESTVDNEFHKLPLELCFLENYGITSSKKEIPEINFELAEEFYYQQELRTTTGN
jgi:hypothetical protein